MKVDKLRRLFGAQENPAQQKPSATEQQQNQSQAASAVDGSAVKISLGSNQSVPTEQVKGANSDKVARLKELNEQGLLKAESSEKVARSVVEELGVARRV